MRIIRIALFGLAIAISVVAQQPAAAQASAPLPSASLGLIVYPAKGQSKDLQYKEEQACYAWANEQTGIDPAKVHANPDSAAKAAGAKTADATQGAAVVGAAKGALGGVAIGAIAGDAGKGAAIGATVGAVAGRRKKKAAEGQAAQAGASANVAQAQGQIDTFKKAMGTCLKGKGYTVS
jgi:hypothetical protein